MYYCNTTLAMKLTGTIDDIIGMGIKTKVKTLGLDIIVSTPHVAEKLAVEPGTPVCRIERLRSIVRQSFSYTLTYQTSITIQSNL
jgi:DNA-binding GntR family transcriptional regulator